MAALRVHNAVEGCSVLIEYQGAASAVVLVTPYAVPADALLRNVALGLARTQSLQGWADQGLGSPLALGVQLLPVQVVQADVNGFGWWVVPLANLMAAGDTLYVTATTVA